MKALLVLATALPIALLAQSANAASYTGKWPATVTHSMGSDGSYCLTLTDNGDLHWPHSGQAMLNSPLTGSLYGTFQVINHHLMATFEQQSDTGQNAGIVFIATARDGTIGSGVFEVVYGGEELDSGETAFGPKGGC